MDRYVYRVLWYQLSYSIYLSPSKNPRRRQWHPLQYSCVENPMDGGAWWAAVHGVVKSRIRLSDFTFTFHFHALENEIATHSSVLAWRIPGTGEPRGLPSMGSHRVRHDWSDLAASSSSKNPNRIMWRNCQIIKLIQKYKKIISNFKTYYILQYSRQYGMGVKIDQ